MKLYNELAEYYFSIEKETRDINSDIRMVRSLLEEIKKPSLLDLGCGTGEHLYILSGFGIDCTGLDSSPAMNEVARRRFPDLKFILDDMKSFYFEEKFDIVISLFGSFDYITEDREINKTLKNTWEALKPGGIGLFEIWNAKPLLEIKEKPLSLVSETYYNNKRIKRERGFRLIEYQDKTLVEVNYFYNIAGTGLLKDRHIMRAFSRYEMADFLEENNFHVIDFYSNSHMEPYKDISNKIIAYFKKPL